MSFKLTTAFRRISFQRARTLPTPALTSIPHFTARSLNTEPNYDGHIPLNWFENAFLAVGSAVMSLADPRRGGTSQLSPNGLS